MEKFLNRLDEFAGIGQEKKAARWLDRLIFIFLVLMILAEPHSIAATQISWLSGMVLWTARLFFKPRPKFFRTPLNLALAVFFGWSLVTAIFSYAPDIALDRLRGVAVMLIFFFVVNNLHRVRAAVFLASALIFSSLVPVIWTPIERLIGRGVEVQNLSADNPFWKGVLKDGTQIKDGDTIFAVGKKKISSPDELLAEIEKNDTTEITYYRPDYDSVVEIKRADLLNGANALEKFGIGGWKHSRNWRSAGTYGHYTTFAEVLQLVGSLILGLFIANLFDGGEKSNFKLQFENLKKRIFTKRSILLFTISALTALALLLTVTRASQIGLLASAFVMMFVAANRKFLLIAAAIILPVALAFIVFQQQSRQVGFFDSKDDSTKERITFYRKGWNLWTDSARNITFGVGMDASKRFTEQWNLYDNENRPMGHFHSTPLQLLVERGFPALLIWLWLLWTYAAILRKGMQDSGFRTQDSGFRIQDSGFGIRDSGSENYPISNWKIDGIILGCFGGMIGFFTGGLVHYNLGDSEVAMAFYMLMGIGVYLAKDSKLEVQGQAS